MDKLPEKVAPQADKDHQHLNPDSLFLNDRLSKINIDGKDIRYWKITHDKYVGYGECLAGEEKPEEAVWVSVVEYYKYQYGEEEYERLKNHFRDYKRMLKVIQLAQIRKNAGDLVKKINKA